MKKIILKLCEILFFVINFAVLFSVNAMAYIDPSVMTYAIQAIAGIVIAIGAIVGLYFRNIRKKINDKLGIDENKNKEIESDEIIINKKGENND